MKINKLFIAALAATTLFASCAKENGTQTPNVAGEPAKLTISFDNSSSEGSRAFDATTETTIKNATAFILSADGAIMDKFFIPTAEINTAEEYETTTAANKVVVIANKDLTSTTATTLAALKAEVATLESLDGATNGFYASGTSAALDWDAAPISTTNGPAKVATATVTMKLLPARLDVTVTNNMTNYDGTKGLVLNDVAVLYSAGFSHWVAATANGVDFYPSTATIAAISGAKYFRSGFMGWASEETAQDVLYATGLLKTWTTPATPFAETFYVYPTLPAASTLAYGKNTILVVRATWKGADGSLTPTETRYFPVHFSTTDKGELVSGKKYNVTINLKGNAGAGGGSVTDPEEEVIPAYISVSVSITPWEPVTIAKEFE